MITAASPGTRVRPEIQKRFSTSSFPPVFYLFIDQTVYPRSVARPPVRPGKFPSGFLARKVKGTAPNPSCTRPHERLFRMRVLAAYVYTVAEFQSAVG